MNKKSWVALIIGVVVVVLIILFLIKGCTPRTKAPETTPLTDATSVDTGDTTLVTDNTFDVTKFKDPFISANTDFTCATIKNPDMTKDDKLVKATLDEAYKKYGFPVDNNDQMLQILNTYENDIEVTNIIRENVKKCKTSN